jgi:hypothetical protein
MNVLPVEANALLLQAFFVAYFIKLMTDVDSGGLTGA